MKYFGLVMSGFMTAAYLCPQAVHAAEIGDLSVSGELTLVNDYRFRGVSLSDKDPALQAALSLEHGSGFYVSAWGSTVDDIAGADVEIDIITGYSHDLGEGRTVDVGLIWYTYPGGNDVNYWEAFSTYAMPLGQGAASVGVNYVWSQENSGNRDNIYVWMGAEHLLGSSPFTLDGYVAFEDGAFAHDKLEWTVGISTEWQGIGLRLGYLDTDQNFREADATVMFSVGVAF
ncbi:TIGR02001 family outer membrane protein [Kordiimonas sediminis]|uniref:TIGR02001 family outer membrane protein n=1 Tax=Kordiimonas sediminis TaxID=1735581 RepID=A0A919E8A3_9PROT|nr:TorF family putative porin [Kordiimonas sediminis]GHF24299.1 TIGR02001 family outer membrane protein [Kordiimonas sediminis]